MELGLFIPHTGAGVDPKHARDFCTAAEALGFDGLWTVDHLILPHHTDSLYPSGRTPTAVADGAIADLLRPNFELATTLAWIAGFTSTIGLGTSVAVLPIRNALMNARQLATLDRYCSAVSLTALGSGG